MRTIVKRSRYFANKLCPKRDKEDKSIEDKKRLEGFAYLYVILWTTTQIFGFLVLFIIFLFSDANYFMHLEDCCTADSYINDNNIPIEECGTKACLLYDFTYDGNRDIIQNRPREPLDGATSLIFEYNDGQWCCNLAESTTKCCDFMPFGSSCGAVMWVCGFSAVCGMLMVQVVISGFYSFTSRRSSLWVLGMTIVGVLLRVFLFFFIFYIFFGFMFTFIFFWVPMLYCDNPYGFAWWKFGLWYLQYFFEHFADIWENGITEWDGRMDMDAMVGCHAVYAFGIDLLFASGYVALNKINKGYYLDLTFFDL